MNTNQKQWNNPKHVTTASLFPIEALRDALIETGYYLYIESEPCRFLNPPFGSYQHDAMCLSLYRSPNIKDVLDEVQERGFFYNKELGEALLLSGGVHDACYPIEEILKYIISNGIPVGDEMLQKCNSHLEWLAYMRDLMFSINIGDFDISFGKDDDEMTDAERREEDYIHFVVECFTDLYNEIVEVTRRKVSIEFQSLMDEITLFILEDATVTLCDYYATPQKIAPTISKMESYIVKMLRYSCARMVYYHEVDDD